MSGLRWVPPWWTDPRPVEAAARATAEAVHRGEGVTVDGPSNCTCDDPDLHALADLVAAGAELREASLFLWAPEVGP
jgi:hypothetical protein